MNPIKVDINDLDKYFVKRELTPAIALMWIQKLCSCLLI